MREGGRMLADHVMKSAPRVPQNMATQRHERLRAGHMAACRGQHLLCRAGLRVAQMGAQGGSGEGVTHGGVDLNLLVLQTDRLGGDAT